MDWEEIIGTLIGGFIILVFLLGALLASINILDNRNLAYETENAFCPEGKTFESAGFGGSITFCKGKQYTCSTSECYWITDSQEKVKDK